MPNSGQGCCNPSRGRSTSSCLGLRPLTNRLRWLKSRKGMLSRTESHLPLIDAKQELERLKQHYEDRTFADRFYAMASDCIAEIYGPIKPGDFNSMSALRGFMACKQ